MFACESFSEYWGQPATAIFKEFLELMSEYAEYFFSKPWPEKYNYDEATKFTDEDVDFLSGGEDEEYDDRLKTVFLKKNINLELGFQGIFGWLWTQMAFEERFVRPSYKPVQEDFEDLKKRDMNPRNVLDKLKEKFDIELIHDSMVDLVEHGLYKPTSLLVGGILELLHKEEGLPPCHDHRCEWERKEFRTNRAQGGCEDDV